MYSTNSAVRENSVELKTITLDADSMWDFIIWLPYAIGFCVFKLSPYIFEVPLRLKIPLSMKMLAHRLTL